MKQNSRHTTESCHDVPPRLQDVFDSILMTRMDVGEEVGIPYATSLLTDLIDIWNDHIDGFRLDFESRIPEDTSEKDRTIMLRNFRKVTLAANPESRRRHVARLLAKCGIKMQGNEKPGKHLAYDHPEMHAVRAWVGRADKDFGIHRRMIANFDQVWTCLYEHGKKVLYKSAVSTQSKPRTKYDKTLALIRSMMQNDGEMPALEVKEYEYRPKPPQLNAQAKMTPVENWRLPRTTTTLTWSDGTMGTAFVSIASGSIPTNVMDTMNEKLKGIIHIHEHDGSSHMWNATTMLHYLQFLTVQLRSRRMQLGLSVAESRALIIADKASVHSCAVFESARKQWEEENNARIVHGSSHDMCRIPGGFGAAGAPNDGIHQWFHKLRRCYMQMVVGQGGNVALRQELSNLKLDVDGNPRFTNFGRQRENLHIHICKICFDDII